MGGATAAVLRGDARWTGAVIFVTVGTHEQPFDRLLREIDRLATSGQLAEDVFCQRGYSGYVPTVPSEQLLPYDEMSARLRRADVVVTHAGPGSVIPALAAGNGVVLVPRQERFGEHVDDHQVRFAQRIASDRGLPVVLEIQDLRRALDEARKPRANPSGRRAALEGIAGLADHIATLCPGSGLKPRSGHERREKARLGDPRET